MEIELPSAELIDDELGLEYDEYLEILRDSIGQTGEKVKELSDAVAKADVDAVHRLAHSIKGSMLNLRIPALAEPAISLDDKAKAKNLEGASADVDELVAAYDALLKKLKE